MNKRYKRSLNKLSHMILLTVRHMPVHAQVCGCIHNQDEQKHVLSQATARASPATLLQCHELPARACQLVEQCQPPRSNEIQMCRPGQYQYVLLPYGGSSRGTLAFVGTLAKPIFQPGSSHSPRLLVTMYGWCTKPAAVKRNI